MDFRLHFDDKLQQYKMLSGLLQLLGGYLRATGLLYKFVTSLRYMNISEIALNQVSLILNSLN